MASRTVVQSPGGAMPQRARGLQAWQRQDVPSDASGQRKKTEEASRKRLLRRDAGRDQLEVGHDLFG